MKIILISTLVGAAVAALAVGIPAALAAFVMLSNENQKEKGKIP